MKKPMGGFVEPFKFTDSQRSELLKAWARNNDHENAINFLSKIESKIELWIDYRKKDEKTIAEKREYANDLLKHSSALIEIFDRLPEGLIKSLDALVADRFYANNKKHEFYQSCEFLRTITNHPDNNFMRGGNYPKFKQMAEVLEVWLYVIADAAKEVTEWKSSSGQDKGYEKLLIQWLADCFYLTFKKAPSSSNGSIFRKFTDRLSTVLNIQLGANIVGEVLKDREYSVLNIPKT